MLVEVEWMKLVNVTHRLLWKCVVEKQLVEQLMQEQSFDRNHPVVFPTIQWFIWSITQHILINNIKNSATCFGSIEPSSGQIQDTVWVHSAGAYTMGFHIYGMGSHSVSTRWMYQYWVLFLRFVVPWIFSHSNKTPN